MCEGRVIVQSILLDSHQLALASQPLTFDPGYLDATATEARTAGPRLVAPCSLKLGGKVPQTHSC